MRYRPLRDIAVDTLQTQMRQHFYLLRVTGFPFTIDDDDLLDSASLCPFDTADADNANVVVVVQLGDVRICNGPSRSTSGAEHDHDRLDTKGPSSAISRGPDPRYRSAPKRR